MKFFTELSSLSIGHHHEKPSGTIDNLTADAFNLNAKSINKRFLKSVNNDENSGENSLMMSSDFTDIKRMRLDSSDKEKNIQLEMENNSAASHSGASQALLPSLFTGSKMDPTRLKETIEADRYN
jgi:hypothetical protein